MGQKGTKDEKRLSFPRKHCVLCYWIPQPYTEDTVHFSPWTKGSLFLFLFSNASSSFPLHRCVCTSSFINTSEYGLESPLNVNKKNKKMSGARAPEVQHMRFKKLEARFFVLLRHCPYFDRGKMYQNPLSPALLNKEPRQQKETPLRC